MNRHIHLFLIPMPFALVQCFWNFVLLSLPKFLSSFEICFRFFHPYCHFVWDIFSFSSRTENLWEILSKQILFSMTFDVCFLSGNFYSFGLLSFICGMWLFKYHTTVHPASFPYIFWCYLPRTDFSVKWMEPQNCIMYFYDLSCFTRIKQDFKVFKIYSDNLPILKYL